MDVYVQVWNLLECGLTDRVPHTQALIGESTTHRTGDTRYHGHQRGARRVVELTHIVEMLPRNDQRVAGVELP